MRDIEIIRAGLENFCNHIEPMELSFSRGHITLITGPNGAGKTSIFQSIPYTLYGSCEKGRGDDVLNDITMKNCHTFVEFSIDGLFYRVDRYLKYTKMGTTVHITKNHEEKPYMKGHREVVAEIEKLLMPQKLFENVLLFSQKTKTFFTDLGDADQKAIFRKILNLDEWLQCFDASGKLIKECKTILSDLETQLKIITNSMVDTTNQIDKHVAEQIKFKEDKTFKIKSINSDIQTLSKELEEMETSFKTMDEESKKSQLEEKKREKTKIDIQLSSIEDEKDKEINETRTEAKIKENEIETKASKSIQAIEDKGIEFNTQINNSYKPSIDTARDKIEKCQISMKEVESIIDMCQSSISNYKSFMQTLIIDSDMEECPTCHQTVDDEARNKVSIKSQEYQTMIDIETEKINSNILKQKELEKELKDATDEKFVCESDLNTDIEDMETASKTKIEEINVKLEEYKQQIEQQIITIIESINETYIEKEKTYHQQLIKLDEDISELTESVTKSTQLSHSIIKQKSVLDGKNTTLKSIEDSEYNTDMLNDLAKKRNQLVDERVSLDQQILEAKDRLEALEFWKDGFSSSGIQSMLIDEAIPILNEEVTKYINFLSNGRYIVSFDTMKQNKKGVLSDKISVNVFDNETHANSRVKISGGQERLIDIATILTLGDLQSKMQDVKFNILLFDEIFDSLDTQNIENVCNLMRLVSQNKSVNIVSHRNIEEIEADETLNIH